MTGILDKFTDVELEKIAKMELSEIPVNQICVACGIDLDELQLLQDTDHYQDIQQKIATNDVIFNQELNNGWDCVEHLAIKSIIHRLQISTDPQFALRAAMVSNKAIRRGMHQQRPLAGVNGQNITINFNRTFVSKVQNNDLKIINRSDRELHSENIPKKQQDFLAPARVESMLLAVSDEDKDAAIDNDDPFAGIGEVLVGAG